MYTVTLDGKLHLAPLSQPQVGHSWIPAYAFLNRPRKSLMWGLEQGYGLCVLIEDIRIVSLGVYEANCQF
jgi:hypothetical protein